MYKTANEIHQTANEMKHFLASLILADLEKVDEKSFEAIELSLKLASLAMDLYVKELKLLESINEENLRKR